LRTDNRSARGRVIQELSNKCLSLADCVASYESVNYAEWIDKLGGAE